MKNFFKLVSVMSVVCGIMLNTDGMNNLRNPLQTQKRLVITNSGVIIYNTANKEGAAAFKSIWLNNPANQSKSIASDSIKNPRTE